MSDTDGVGTFPGNPYLLSGEYGPASTDVRHRATVSGSLNTKWNVRFSPLLTVQSGAPFDITTGSDLYGTTLFNSRPGVATDTKRPGLVATSYGLLDPNPIPGEQILSRNYALMQLKDPNFSPSLQMKINDNVEKIYEFNKFQFIQRLTAHGMHSSIPNFHVWLQEVFQPLAVFASS